MERWLVAHTSLVRYICFHCFYTKIVEKSCAGANACEPAAEDADSDCVLAGLLVLASPTAAGRDVSGWSPRACNYYLAVTLSAGKCRKHVDFGCQCDGCSILIVIHIESWL